MPDSNTINRTTDAPVINWEDYGKDDYRLVLVGVKEVEKNWLKRLYYRHVPEFKAIPNKSTRYCVLLLENKVISGTYTGEITYFEVDQFRFRTVTLNDSRVDFFRKKDVCTGTIECVFEENGIDDKFILPSYVEGGIFIDKEINKRKMDDPFNDFIANSKNKYISLENIIEIHTTMDSFFFGRTSNYVQSDERCFPNEKILSMNKIMGTDPLEKNFNYWAKILPAYFFHSSEGLKKVHLKDYQNTILLNSICAGGLIISSFVEFYMSKFNIGLASLASGSAIFWDTMFRASHNAVYIQATKKICNRPGVIGTVGDFLKLLKRPFRIHGKNKNS